MVVMKRTFPTIVAEIGGEPAACYDRRQSRAYPEEIRGAFPRKERLMKRWTTIVALSFATLLWSGLAGAQTARDDDDRGDGGRHQERFAFGIGAGFVEPSGDVENYFMASLGIRTSGRGSQENTNGSRGHDPRGDGMTGYIEPEVGYWESSGNKVSGSDTLLGVNLIGVVPMGS